MYEDKQHLFGRHKKHTTDEPSLSLQQLADVMGRLARAKKAAQRGQHLGPQRPAWMDKAQADLAGMELDEIERKMRDRGLR